MKLNKKSLVKVLSVFCVIAITLTTLFANFGIISALTDGSDDSTVSKDDFFTSGQIYKFESDEDPVTNNSVAADSINMTRGGDGKGVMGWTYNIVNRGGEHGSVLYSHNDGFAQTWATGGGYRLNNYDGVYRLKPSATYLVNFEINLTSAPKSTETFKDINTSTLSIGYGAWDAPGDDNGFNSMSVKLYDVVSVKTDAEKYTVKSTEGTVEYKVNSGWHKVSVLFTSPDNFGNLDNALSFYSVLWPYSKLDIDNVEVIKLSKEQGAIVFTDDYHDKNTIAVGKVGEKANLPIITPADSNHKFEGWYSTYDRKDDAKIEEIAFKNGITTVYARINAPVTITFKNTLTGEETKVTGNPGETIKFPANPIDSVKKFKAWYKDDKYTVPFTDEIFYYSNITVYSCFINPPETVTFENYGFDKTNRLIFGDLIKVTQNDNAGNGDNSALCFTYDADKKYIENADGTVQYQKDRYNMPDHTAIIKENLKPDTVYKISYDVKAEKANLDYSISFATASKTNIWGNLNMYRAGENYANRITFSKSTAGKGWVRKTVILETPENFYVGGVDGSSLYVYFTVSHNLDNGAATVFVDNISIEEATAPLAAFLPVNCTEPTIIEGAIGEEIVYNKKPQKFGFIFDDWYTDLLCTKKQENTKFSRNNVILNYAGYTESKTKTFDYEDYNVPYAEPSKSIYLRHDCKVVTYKNAYSGTHVMEADRSVARNPNLNPGGAGHLVKSGDIVQKLKKGTNYIITFKYYIETQGQAPLRVRAHAGSSVNFWGSSLISNTYNIALDEEVGKWHTGTLVCNGDLIAETWQDHLYLSWNSGTEGMYYFDDVTVTELQEGKIAYFIDNGGCNNIPEYVVGSIGQNFSSQLPKNPKYDNHDFLGYYILGDDGKFQLFNDFVFRKNKTPEIVARFIRIKTIQDFETFYAPAIDAMPGYNIIDYDYELYDATKEGNSKDNVTSGKYSLHRLGERKYNENALLLTQAQQIVAGEKYTVTFKVKMGKHTHTNGAVKLVSCNSGIFAWATYGDYYPVIAIADLTDGQWHEVSYTFTAIEPYVSLQTPGYVELFFDDFVFTHVSDSAVVSKPVQYTEYVLSEQEEAIDVTTIIDLNLGKGKGKVAYVVIGGAVVLAIVAATIILAVFKKRRIKKGGQK